MSHWKVISHGVLYKEKRKHNFSSGMEILLHPLSLITLLKDKSPEKNHLFFTAPHGQFKTSMSHKFRGCGDFSGNVALLWDKAQGNFWAHIPTKILIECTENKIFLWHLIITEAEFYDVSDYLIENLCTLEWKQHRPKSRMSPQRTKGQAGLHLFLKKVHVNLVWAGPFYNFPYS